MNNWKKIVVLGLLCFIPYIGIPLYIFVVLVFLVRNGRFVKNGIIKGHKEIGLDLEEKQEPLPKFDGQTFADADKLV